MNELSTPSIIITFNYNLYQHNDLSSQYFRFPEESRHSMALALGHFGKKTSGFVHSCYDAAFSNGFCFGFSILFQTQQLLLSHLPPVSTKFIIVKSHGSYG
ncbi:hypothetical protein MKW92_034316 [Papaver armeniacum]|nr:hypothetical protein MKW92_034316 [Papaver armeniacum]